MDKLKKGLKKLFAPAIVLMLVAVMGIFSPVISVAAALHLHTAAEVSQKTITVENLPARTVKVGDTITVPSAGNDNTVELWHAGKQIDITNLVTPEYYYIGEVGQYEWRFYRGKDNSKVLYDTYTVTATKAAYTMTMPSTVATVAPKNMENLVLPLPESYTFNGDSVDATVAPSNDKHYATVTLKNEKKNINVTARLYAVVSLENETFDADQITFAEKNLTINMTNYKTTGKLKVTYVLKENKDSKAAVLVATPLSTIEIKNLEKSSVTFANIPTAPSVSGLSYYSNVTLSAPTADSAKAGKETFAVEADTVITEVQYSLYPTEPKEWKVGGKVQSVAVENGILKNDIIEIDGLNVKVKKLGWFRFKFKTSTLFGYTMDSDFSNDAVKQNGDSVEYWGDSVKIYRDNVYPDFAWVESYNAEQKDSLNKKYEDGDLTDFDAYLPLSSQPDSTTDKKITVNFSQGLTLPAIFPHDNATGYADLTVSSFAVEQIQDANGNKVDYGTNAAFKGTTANASTFIYDQTKAMQIKFGNVTTQGNNEVTLKKNPGLYRVTITVLDKEPVFDGTGERYSSYNNAHATSKYLYFTVANDTEYEWGVGKNSPVIDENKTFQISDVYAWEGNTFDFTVPSFEDSNTPTNDLVIDYYLVRASDKSVVKKLDYTDGASRVNVEITEAMSMSAGNYYIYAVARNFNAMQANLKKQLGTATMNDTEYFHEDDFALIDQDEVKQYGYAWKRAAFTYYAADNTNSADIKAVTFGTNDYKAGNAVHIDTIETTGLTDGQMSVAVYSKKDHKQYDIYNGNTANAEVVSSIIANQADKFVMKNLYFTPDVSGDYLLVVTAKEHASNTVKSRVVEINIGNSDDWNGRLNGLSTADDNTSDAVDSTIILGNSLTLPGVQIYNGNQLTYVSKNRNLYLTTNDTMVAADGYYTITVMGTSDANCVTGNKFTPNKTGKYKFRYECYKGSEVTPFYTINCVVQVNASNASANILMGEDYNDETVLLNNITVDNTLTQDYFTIGKSQDKYALGNGKNTATVPAYAVTLEQFRYANYGAEKDFVVNSAWLYDYLEPIYDATANNKISGYMYPAIAIPMPNVISDTTSSDEVEITVQKSGSSAYLVSNKKMNCAENKASVIDTIGDFFVFRPEGTFNTNCKTAAYDANTYSMAATSKSAISGVYTVTYKTSSTTVSYNITIGNLENGAVTIADGFLTYNDGKENKNITDSSDKLIIDKDENGHRYVTIDMAKFAFSGNKEMENLIKENGEDKVLDYYWNNVRVKITFADGKFIDSTDWVDGGDGKAIKDKNSYTYKFDLTMGSGTYKVTAEMTNKYTNSPVSQSIEFTLDAESTNKNVNLNTVWGIILIVLSVGLLAGVIFYFVKTARATRFVDAPRALKAKDKKEKTDKDEKNEKEPTKPVAAPKAEEAPKNDAK